MGKWCCIWCCCCCAAVLRGGRLGKGSTPACGWPLGWHPSRSGAPVEPSCLMLLLVQGPLVVGVGEGRRWMDAAPAAGSRHMWCSKLVNKPVRQHTPTPSTSILHLHGFTNPAPPFTIRTPQWSTKRPT